MNAPAPSPDYRDHEDYRAGAILYAKGEALPVPASTPLMQGYLAAMEPTNTLLQLYANGPGMREPFTQRAADMPTAAHRPAARHQRKTARPSPTYPEDDAAARSSAPSSISIVDKAGVLLRAQDLKRLYVEMIVAHCGGNRSQAARLLREHPRTISRMLRKRGR